MSLRAPLASLHRELRAVISRPTGRRAFLAALPVLLAGCASRSRHRYREGDNTGQETSLTIEDEKTMAREYLPKMRGEYPSYNDAYAQSYIGDLGARMVAANDLRGKPYRYTFEIVESEHVNAFALPAGTVFVTKPLVALAESEAELAGVVGHEIGHIQARHTAERIEQAKKEEGRSLLYGLGGAIIGGAAGFGLGRLICKKQDRECLARIAGYGIAAGGAGGLLIQKFAFMANSREDEMEADRIGFRTSLKAGYHPDHVGNFYEKLLVMEEKHKRKQDALSRAFVDAMSTHPPSKERVAQMEAMKREASGKMGSISSPAFAKVKDALG